MSTRWPVIALVLLSSSVLLTGCYSTETNTAENFPPTATELKNSKPSGDEAGSVATDVNLNPQSASPLPQNQTLQQYPAQANTLREGNPMDVNPNTQPSADLPADITQLQVQPVQPGSGATVELGDTVTAQYKGQLTNGTVFDQGTFSFQVGAGMVIQGWDQGFVGLQEGGQYRLLIPSELGYGERGAGQAIPPNADLIFDVKVVKIEK